MAATAGAGVMGGINGATVGCTGEPGLSGCWKGKREESCVNVASIAFELDPPL